jgi:hypothetical protein
MTVLVSGEASWTPSDKLVLATHLLNVATPQDEGSETPWVSVECSVSVGSTNMVELETKPRGGQDVPPGQVNAPRGLQVFDVESFE